MFPLSKGKVSKQAHVGLPDGTYEEEHGREAFDGRASHLYRTHLPTAWVRIDGPLQPRAYDLNGVKPADMTEASGDWQRILWNEDVAIHVSRRREAMPYFLRDADGDLCYFVHHGAGLLETDYGPLRYRAGDFLVLPKGTTHRIVPDANGEDGGAEETFLYVIEGSGEYRLPDKGILGRHALFDPGVLEVPEPQAHDEAGEFEVRVKRGGEHTTLTYPFHPLDVVGWQGDLCPLRLNVEDFRPVVSPRYHLPPSVHITFDSDGFEIGTFAPRPTETGDPEALRVPFFHSNIDKDEVLFYHRGQFFSRAGIGEGFITHHPQGLHHGPQPAALEAGKTKEFADEYAIMVEADRPFERDDALEAVEVEGYSTSWARGLGLID
ncbi:MAG: homogentisate 1,2-dioxygenase [Actinobacteria bacterium]|nr:homogentisate 1,2-dioxygenase [Actinomycetota bacterium]